MRRARFQEQERRLATERRVKFRGTASIKLEVLNFQWDKTENVAHQKNVKRLLKLFRDEGCHPLKLRNHIVGLIDQQRLDKAVRDLGISAEQLFADPRDGDDYPKLDFPAGYQLECLDGHARVDAAARVLPLGDKRWTVDLYLADINQELKATLIEEYSNEKKPHPGEVYRKIRYYHLRKDPQVDNWWFEKRWWAHLSDHEKQNVEQLWRHDDFTSRCDDLLDIWGLWGDWIISPWHKVIAMRGDEYVLNYFDHMKDFWYKRVLKENTQAMQKVDQATVKALELTAPGACRADARILYGLLMSGQIFGAFSQQERNAMWPIICSWSTHRLIPSFFGFFQDVNYLEGPADCVKRLISVSHGATILSALEDSFSDVNQRANQCVIQESETTFAFKPGSLRDRFELGHLQLFLFGMRDYLEMPREPKKKNLLAKSRSRADTKVLREFAALAYRLGFDSDKIRRLMHLESPSLTSTEQTASLDADDSPPRRCGIPLQQHHEQDKSSLFLSKLHEGHEEEFEEMTSFFVRRSVIFTFFGKPTCTGPSINHVQPSSPPATQSTELFVAPAGPGHPTPVPQQRQSPRLSTDARQGFQTAAAPQLDGPSSDIPRQDEVIGSLREELTTRCREVDELQAQKTTLEGAISEKDKELQKQSTALESFKRANGELEKSLSKAKSEANTLRSEKDRLSADLTTAQSTLKALNGVQEAVSATRSEMAVETKLEESLSRAQSETEKVRAEKCRLEKDKTTMEAQLKESLSRAQSEIEKVRAEKCKLEGDKTTMEAQLKESLSKAESQTEELRAEKAKLEEDKTAIESKLKGSLITAQSEIASLRVEKNKLEGDEAAVLSDLRARITLLETGKMELESCRDDAQQAFTAEREDLRTEITRLEAERMEATTMLEDVEKEKQDLQSQMDTMVASLSHEIESLTRSRDTESDQRSRAEEQCQTMQKNLDLENQGKLEAMEKLTKSQREIKLVREGKSKMARRIETLEAELKILRAQVTAPTSPPTVEQGTPLPPEVQSAEEADVDDTFTSVLNKPLNAQNSLPNIFEQIPNSGELPTPTKRQSMLPPLLQRPFPTSDPPRVAKHVDQPRMMNRIGKSGVVAAPRMNKIQARTRGPQAGKLFFDEVLFKIVEKSKISSTIPFERTQVENSAKGYWRKMHLFSSTGQGILPRMCFDTLVQEGTQTIFLIPKGHQVDVNQELINSGIREDARTDEGERVVEIESENEELVQPEAHQSRKRKRSIHDDLQRPPTNDHEQGETSMVRYKGAKRAQ